MLHIQKLGFIVPKKIVQKNVTEQYIKPKTFKNVNISKKLSFYMNDRI